MHEPHLHLHLIVYMCNNNTSKNPHAFLVSTHNVNLHVHTSYSPDYVSIFHEQSWATKTYNPDYVIVFDILSKQINAVCICFQILWRTKPGGVLPQRLGAASAARVSSKYALRQYPNRSRARERGRPHAPARIYPSQPMQAMNAQVPLTIRRKNFFGSLYK